MDTLTVIVGLVLAVLILGLLAYAWMVRGQLRRLHSQVAEMTGWISSLDDSKSKQSQSNPAKSPLVQGLDPREFMLVDSTHGFYSVSLQDVFDDLESRFIKHDLVLDRRRNLKHLEGDSQGALHLLTTLWNFAGPLKLLATQLSDHVKQGQRIVWHIADFGSDDISIEDLLENSPIPYCLYLHEGPFSKPKGMQTLVESPWIPDDAIIVCVDADMSYSTEIYDRIRREVVAGKQFYAPLMGYLNEAGELYGIEHESGGHGFLAVAKSDSQRIGGYAAGIYRYKFTWGGEETDFAARLEQAGLHKVRDIEPRITAGHHKRPDTNRWYETCTTNEFHDDHQGETVKDTVESDVAVMSATPRLDSQPVEGPIITPILTHGLGNKLFQVAAALGVAAQNKGLARFVICSVTADNYERNKSPLTADWLDFEGFGGHGVVKVEGLPGSLAELFPRLSFEAETVEPRVLRKKASKYLLEPYNVGKDGFYYETQDFGPLSGNVTLEGYFFSHKHYSARLPEIHDRLTPAEAVTRHIDQTFGELIARRPVALHIRFGVKRDHYRPLVPSINWYRKALDTTPGDGPVLVCSDDVGAARLFLSELGDGRDFVFVEGQPQYVDMFLMSRCAHMVFSISTLAAWAAILNRSADKVIVCHPHYRVKYGRASPLPGWVVLADNTEVFQSEKYGAREEAEVATAN